MCTLTVLPIFYTKLNISVYFQRLFVHWAYPSACIKSLLYYTGFRQVNKMSLLQASLLRRNTKREHKSVGLVLSFPAFCFLLCGLSQFVCFNATNLMWEYKHVLREDIPSPWLALGIDFFFLYGEEQSNFSAKSY